MKHIKQLAAIALLTAVTSCTVLPVFAVGCSGKDSSSDGEATIDFADETSDSNAEDIGSYEEDNKNPSANAGETEETEETEKGEEEKEQPAETSSRQNTEDEATAGYIRIDADGVYVRSGAGVKYAALGVTEKGTLYPLSGISGNWYKTTYRGGAAYIYSTYCSLVTLSVCSGEVGSAAEEVIAEGYKCLGKDYVYGATRYLSGGKVNPDFDADEFDCSSLTQYIFYRGAGVVLGANTRTQILQGESVSSLSRGDLLFFTNDSRKNNSGIERVGHVALYLGGNYILHTSSDYAKIEQISATRWGYFIEARRMIN